MEFYKSINHFYDLIFPLNNQQVEFVAKEIKMKQASLLDIGCATGNLAIALVKNGFSVKAFDLDSSMIESASAKTQINKPMFRVGNMLNIQTDYSTEEFDGILCFGNTLVHLNDNNSVEKFFKSVHQKLKEGGKFLFQILNYQYIVESQLSSLPLIDNEHVTFVREYDYLQNGFINFRTKLFIKESKTEIKNEVKLLPLTQAEVKNLLQHSGFKNIEFFGSFAKSELQKNSIPLVVKTEK